MCLPVNPFKVEREWEHAGLKCAVVQAREASHRCAYVRGGAPPPPPPPLHGKDYDHAEADLNVHGGITFAQAEPCEEIEEIWPGVKDLRLVIEDENG